MTQDVPSGGYVLRRGLIRLQDETAAITRRRRLARVRIPAPAARVSDAVVSLTSHRARFDGLSLALRSILDQSIRPSCVLLWVPRGDREALPVDVLDLGDVGLQIRTLESDQGPASKLLPTLVERPDRTVVTADDDVAYPYTWLASLMEESGKHPGAIVCHRAHWITFDTDGVIRPYAEWEWETTQCGPDARLFFTGHGGVLYPPGSLSATVHDDRAREAYAPTNDDIWFNWMARLKGTLIVRVPRRSSRRDSLPGSERSSLMRVNLGGGGNDAAVRAMARAFGRLDPATGAVVRSADG